jgi:hypothetical protein
MKINNKIKTIEILGCNERETFTVKLDSKEFKGKLKSDELINANDKKCKLL